METVPQLEDHLCFALYRASRAVIGLYREPLAKLGITYPQYLVLVALWEHDGLTVGALGSLLDLDSGTLSPLVRRLGHHGLVERRRDAADERVVRVHLTPAGRKLHGEAPAVYQQLATVNNSISYTPDQIRDLRTMLNDMTRTATCFTQPTPRTTRGTS